jgi:hypothetical protein
MYQVLFYTLFLSQILTVYVCFPRRILSRVRYVIKQYPPSTYPKLYPVPVEVVERRLGTYRLMNLGVLVVGLALVLRGLSSPTEEMLNWDSQSVLAIYFFLQMSPLLILERSVFKYFRLMRGVTPRTVRRAELQPRHLFDFVSPALVGVAIVSYVAIMLLLLYVRQDPFPGFAGDVNFIFITGLNVSMAAVAVRLIYGKKRDPHQAYQDRLKHIALRVRTLVFTCIVANTFLTIMFVLPAFELRRFDDLFEMLYFQVLVLVGSQALRIDDMDFDVYKEDPAVA